MIAAACRPSPGTRIAGVVATAAIAVAVLAGCTAGTADEPAPPATAASSSPSPDPTSEAASEDPEMEEAFAERDAFFAEQGFDGSGPLTAKTDAQRALVQAQKEWTEQQGEVWDERTESILLALGSDTCETGILNQHRIDAPMLKKLIVSSPLTAELIPADASPEQATLYERNIASMSVFSASYLCPADTDAWQAAFTTAYPG